MEYIIVDNDIIIEHYCGDTLPSNAIAVPNGFKGYIGANIKSLLPDMSGFKPLSQQVAENILAIPEGYKINSDDNAFIQLTQEELNSKYPVEIWAIPDTYEEIKVYKEFKNNILDYWPPSHAIKMIGSQPDVFYKATKNGNWIIDSEKKEEYILTQAKEERAEAVSKIIITVDGMKFDGDEVSQERMSRTITAAKASNEPDSSTTTWVLADNTIATPTIAQLIKALRLAGEEQTKLWTVPYTTV